VILVMNVMGVYRDRILFYFFNEIRYRVEVISSISPHTIPKFIENLRVSWKMRARTQMQLAENFQIMTF